MGRASRARPQEGWLLAGLIVLISAVILALGGITFFLTEHLRVISLRQNQTRAIYLAQAGVMQAIYDFRNGSNISPGTWQTIDAGSVAGQADDDVALLQPLGTGSMQEDFLLMNMRATVGFVSPKPSYCGATRDRFEHWPVRNVLAAGAPLVVNSVQLSWSPAGGERVIRIDLNGTGLDWAAAGCQSGCTAVTCNTTTSGVPINTAIDLTTSVPVANRQLNPGTRWSNNRIWFNNSTTMAGKDSLDVTFGMSDGSSRTSHWDRLATANRTADITLKSVGEVRKETLPFTVWRRLEADYRVCGSVSGTQCDATGEERSRPGNIMSYRERTTLTDP